MTGEDEGYVMDEIDQKRENLSEENPSQGDGDSERIEEENESAPPEQITMDRYSNRWRSQRPPPTRQFISIGLMIVALVMILVYQAECGGLASSFFDNFAPSGKEAKDPRE